jgi:hypothetical protein
VAVVQRKGSVVRWSVLLTFLSGVGVWLLSAAPRGAAQLPTQLPQGRAIRVQEPGWNIEKFASGIKRPGYLPRLAFDSASNLYIANVGDLGIPNDGGIIKVDANTRKEAEFSDAADVAAIAFDAKGNIGYSTGVVNAMSEIYYINRPDGTAPPKKIVRGEFLLRMMPGIELGAQAPQIAWSLVYGKPDAKGEQPLYAGTSAFGLGGNDVDIDGRILRVNADGTEVRGIANPYDVADMVMAADGSLLFADNYDNVISRVVPDGIGNVTRYATLSATTPTGVMTVPVDLPALKRMAMDTGGNVYVLVRESDVKTNIYKISAPLQNRSPRVTLFAANLPTTVLPVLKHDSKGNLYLVDYTDSGLDIYRLTRGARP